MKEVFVPISYPYGDNFSHYEISNLGRVRNTHTGKFKKPGYCSQSPYHRTINLCNKGKVKGFHLSRLVGTHFLPFIPGGNILHLKEELPEDQVNTLSNLYIGTQSQNIQDSFDKGRKNLPDNKGEKHGYSILTEDQVKEIRRLWETPNHPTRKVLGSLFGVSPHTIKLVVLRRTWKHI